MKMYSIGNKWQIIFVQKVYEDKRNYLVPSEKYPYIDVYPKHKYTLTVMDIREVDMPIPYEI